MIYETEQRPTKQPFRYQQCARGDGMSRLWSAAIKRILRKMRWILLHHFSQAILQTERMEKLQLSMLLRFTNPLRDPRVKGDL